MTYREPRPGQGHFRHGRGFHGQSGQILWFEGVHVGLAASARHHLAFDRQGVQEVVYADGRFVGVEALAQLWVRKGYSEH